MKKILLSASFIVAASAALISGTYAIFSDSEENTGNTFTAGAIDINVVGDNFVWEDGAALEDMKPSYTDYIDFTINNKESGANPVNVYKQIKNVVETTETTTEPECIEEHGSWDNGVCINNTEVNDLSNEIIYDLKVTVYNEAGDDIWNQILYVDADGESINSVYNTDDVDGNMVFLGMIPAMGYMKVSQSYHLNKEAGNEYQTDKIAFGLEVKGEQLAGEAWLEDKRASDWKLDFVTPAKGTLNYKMKNSTFDFEFSGVAPLATTEYVLAIGYNADTDVDTFLGKATSDGSGNISIVGDVELNKSMKDVKVWLVPSADWTGDTTTPGSAGTANFGQMPDYLWETGMIWYEDTDV